MIIEYAGVIEYIAKCAQLSRKLKVLERRGRGYLYMDKPVYFVLNGSVAKGEIRKGPYRTPTRPDNKKEVHWNMGNLWNFIEWR